MNKLLVQGITDGKYFTQPVFLDSKYVLLSPETPFDATLKKRLDEWGFHHMWSDGHPTDTPVASIETADEAPLLALEEGVKEQEQLRETQKFYTDTLSYTEKLFTDFVTKNEIQQRMVSDRVKDTVDHLRNRRRFLLRLTALRQEEKNYIVEHSVKTTILSLAIGLTLRLPPHKTIELGMTALLHEIGMIRLPPQIYMSDQPLTAQEKKAISAHTLLGFKILKGLSFPMSVCIGVLECREYNDGTGYPRGITGDRISFYAKIIMVAGSYAAMTSNRPFRQAHNGHQAMLELLQGRGTRYEENVLRALLSNLSLYPIGTFVQLANGYRGMVVDSMENNPRTPIVRIMISASGERYADQPHVKTIDQEYRVVRSLSRDEVDKIVGAAHP